MTEPGAVRVTVAKACPAGCKEGRRQVKVIGQTRAQHRFRDGGECSTCHGRGMVDEPVSCASCERLGPAGDIEHWCHSLNCEVWPEWACASWSPIEP